MQVQITVSVYKLRSVYINNRVVYMYDTAVHRTSM